MNGTTDMPSVVNGAKTKSFVALIRKLRLNGVFGKSGVAEVLKVPDDTW